MQDSQVPTKIPKRWADSASGTYVNVIPTASQIGVVDGRASFTDGFPPLNFTPVAAGGVPPFGGDMNGALQQVTDGLRWLQAGGLFPFDQTFATAVGGYPKNALVASATTDGLIWRSTVDNNTSNPDTGGANWVSQFQLQQSLSDGISYTTAGSFTFTPPALIYKAHVRAWAGGAGGGGATGAPAAGAGGGGGEYREGWFAVTPGVGVPIVVGAGGTAGSSGGGNGGNGGQTTFGSGPAMTCQGGIGGQGGISGNAGGFGSGGSGGAGGFFSQAGDIGGLTVPLTGIGHYMAQGGPAFGGNWHAGFVLGSGSSAGATASGAGGGGGGGVDLGGGGVIGGVGHAGTVIIDW